MSTSTAAPRTVWPTPVRPIRDGDRQATSAPCPVARDAVSPPGAAVDHWTRRQRLAHWATVLLYLVQLPTGFATAAAVAAGADPVPVTANVHAIGGTLILLLGAARLFWRWRLGRPPLAADMPRWQRATARASHALLYVLVLAIPLSGLAFLVSDAAGAGMVHGALMRISLALIALHAAAALTHQFLHRDGTLTRMLWPASRGR